MRRLVRFLNSNRLYRLLRYYIAAVVTIELVYLVLISRKLG